ncbi:24074_t:CDS:2 [Gigaspora rosea]|nr:24074_t:CDS:2 [Gigaspora rosea]
MISNKRALITDFGISKSLKNSTTKSSITIKELMVLGVLFWELTSGVPPFNDRNDFGILLEILNNNKREIPIPNTPNNFIDLFQTCWSDNLNWHPTPDNILSKLKRLSEENIEFISNTIKYINYKFINESTAG